MDTNTSWFDDDSPREITASWFDESGKMTSQDYQLTQGFNDYNPDIELFSGGRNSGVDIATPLGTPVRLPDGQWEVIDSFNDSLPGWIGNNSNNGWGGSTVLRDKKTGYTLRLSHLSKNDTKIGDLLQGGSLIGNTGTSGNSSGSHLSIDIQDPHGNYVDPFGTPYAGYLPVK